MVALARLASRALRKATIDHAVAIAATGHGRPPQCVLLLQDKVTAAGKKVRMNPAAGFMGTLQAHSR